MAKKYIIGIYDDEEKFVSAVRGLLAKDIPVQEVFSPYPVREVLHLLKRSTRLPTAAYFFGLFGMAGTLAFLYYTSVVNWPIVYGGKPFNSFPSFMVVTIVLTIFTVTVLGLALFSARSKIIPGRENTVFDLRATDNRFVILVDAEKDITNLSVEIMKVQGALEISEREYEVVKF